MRISVSKIWLLPVLILLPISIVALRSRDSRPLEALPSVILWAWERPEKLDFINPDQVGVAFLAKTLTLQHDRVLTRPRLQPLELAPNTKLIAVVRIESDRPSLSPTQLDQAATQIINLSNLSGISVVQIDFDATLSERNFYRALLTRVRRDLSPSISLSITALASWCAGDNWLSDLPIDEAVPMLFRVGRFNINQRFTSPICQSSAGVSTDEPIGAPTVERLYIFNPKSWSRDSLNSALEAFTK
jgi:hypothetical protein